ncbi:MAG: DUF4430 domain-containing protein [Firmicutes bacterium]|nr:DUF4430 domain-containing protein [Bacillota bacterium]
MSRSTTREQKRQKRRPGGRLLPLAVIFVLLFTCVFFTGCGSEEQQGDTGVTVEQNVSAGDAVKDKPAKKEAKKEDSKSKDKKAEKDSGKQDKNSKTASSKTEGTRSGNSSPDKNASDRSGSNKEKTERSSSDNNRSSGDSHKDSHKKKTAKYCYFSVTCHTLTAIKDELPDSLQKLVPDSGVIVRKTKVKLKGGESAFDITKKVLREKKIHISYQGTTQYGTAYIEAINNIYEKDVNSRSGWIYKVNGKAPGVGCSAYQIGKNDVIEWAYTCDLGEDL